MDHPPRSFRSEPRPRLHASTWEHLPCQDTSNNPANATLLIQADSHDRPHRRRYNHKSPESHPATVRRKSDLPAWMGRKGIRRTSLQSVLVLIRTHTGMVLRLDLETGTAPGTGPTLASLRS